ncbi:hypothetical protein OC844_007726, partial [Tilletia horrida]
ELDYGEATDASSDASVRIAAPPAEQSAPNDTAANIEHKSLTEAYRKHVTNVRDFLLAKRKIPLLPKPDEAEDSDGGPEPTEASASHAEQLHRIGLWMERQARPPDPITPTNAPDEVNEMDEGQNDGDECGADGMWTDDVKNKSTLPELIPGIEERLPAFFYGLGTGVQDATLTGTPEQEAILSAIRRRMGKKRNGPHFDRIRNLHDDLRPYIETLRRPEWSDSVCKEWAHLGFSPDDFDQHGFLCCKPMPKENEDVEPIDVVVALTFPVSEAHMCAHEHVKRRPCFTMCLLAAALVDFPWARSVLATDTQMHAMTATARVPWHGSGTQKVFDAIMKNVVLQSGADIIFLAAGSNRERCGIFLQEHLQDGGPAIDFSHYLGAPAVAVPIEGRMRVVVFGPHPSAAHARSGGKTNLSIEYGAYTQLLASLRAIDFVMTGERNSCQHPFKTNGWPIVASCADDYSFRELLRSQVFTPGVTPDDALTLVPFARRPFAPGQYVHWTSAALPGQDGLAGPVSPKAVKASSKTTRLQKKSTPPQTKKSTPPQNVFPSQASPAISTVASTSWAKVSSEPMASFKAANSSSSTRASGSKTKISASSRTPTLPGPQFAPTIRTIKRTRPEEEKTNDKEQKKR